MDESEARKLSLQLMETAWAVYVTTIDGKGSPHTRAMDNWRSKERFPKLTKLFESNDDVFWILLGTNTSSAKMRHLKENKSVNVYYCEPREFHGVMFSGFAEVVTDRSLKEEAWHDYWTMYYPKGVTDPDYTVLSLHPIRAEGWMQKEKIAFDLKERK
jgi:general stress protein 26